MKKNKEEIRKKEIENQIYYHCSKEIRKIVDEFYETILLNGGYRYTGMVFDEVSFPIEAIVEVKVKSLIMDQKDEE